MFLESTTNTKKLMEFNSFSKVLRKNSSTKLKKVLFVSLFAFIGLMILPWTQNIQTNGVISSLSPNQRPQQINSIIAGSIAKWYIKDGQIVKKGDTLLRITEVKEEYLDSSLLLRVNEQITAKNASLDFYQQKANTTTQQENALRGSLGFKMSQLRNKLKQYNLQVQSDSISFTAARNQQKIAAEQLTRQQQLYTAGLKSLTELEQRQQSFQDAQAKRISAENKYYNSKNELLNIMLDLSGTEQEYAEKISKTNGDRFTALSQLTATQSEVAKLKNQFENYRQRQKFYVIKAPQAGQVIRTIKAGLGETVKEGEQLMQIVPVTFDAAVEMYIAPVDMPLINLGQKVRLQFDGFPAIIFSGWPQASYGTFGGKVSAIDPSIDESGKFRIWITPDGTKPWPKEIRYGGGTQGIALLKDVPVIYELWRKLNGFPPEYYAKDTKSNKEKK